MRKRNGDGNGSGATTGVRFTNEGIDENPYLQQRSNEHEQPDDQDESDLSKLLREVEEGPAVDSDDEQKRATQRRRRLALVGVAAVLFATMIVALALYYRTSTRVEYGQSAKQRAVVPPPPNGDRTTSRDNRTEKAIEEAQRITLGTGKSTATVIDPPPATTETAHASSTPADTPFTIPTAIGATGKPAPDGWDTRTDTEDTGANRAGSTPVRVASDQRTTRSQRSPETSLYMVDPAEQRDHSPVNVSMRANPKPLRPRAVITPAFGTMLPVRTIGALYTLRTGALVRFELTRDMKGNGWSMKRGTIVVGSSKGSDIDRAYVRVLGFIDPHSGKLVKLGGDVRGGDGGDGLKGKRRQVDGGWARALGKVSTAALAVTGSLISDQGRDTVVISDGLRTRAINPVTDEIGGVLGGELDRKQSRGFVEVVAGTPGYVMVTDLPAVIKGREASEDLDGDSLALLTDVEAARPATGLSERELAELLANGSPEQIRAALPRMSPEMRKIAEAVLAP